MPARLTPAERAAAAWSFLLRTAFMLAFLACVALATVLFMEPCTPGVLVCAGAPLVRLPHAGRGPRWLQRWLLSVRLLVLQGRRNTIEHDAKLLQKDLAHARHELDQCHLEAAEVDEQIAWARSDLAGLK